MTADATSTTLADRTRGLVAAITALIDRPDPAWSAPSPCEGWDAGDVLDHLMDTERGMLAEHDVALGDLPEGDRVTRWRVHADQLVDALSDPAVVDHSYEGYFGPTTIGESFGTFYVFDLVVHRWDLATALGGDTALGDDELDLVAATVETAGDNLYVDGICDQPVDVPLDASRRDRVLALTGRDASAGAG